MEEQYAYHRERAMLFHMGWDLRFTTEVRVTLMRISIFYTKEKARVTPLGRVYATPYKQKRGGGDSCNGYLYSFPP